MKRRNGVLILAAAVLSGFGASSASGEEGSCDKRGPCEDPISQERQDRLLERLGEEGIDANGDGVLTCDEVKPFFKAHGRPHHHRHRKCEDPIPNDRQGRLQERFGEEGIDVNGDGDLTCEEVKAFFQAHGPHRPPSSAGGA